MLYSRRRFARREPQAPLGGDPMSAGRPPRPRIGYLLPTRDRIMAGSPDAAPLLALAEKAEALRLRLGVGGGQPARPPAARATHPARGRRGADAAGRGRHRGAPPRPAQPRPARPPGGDPRPHRGGPGDPRGRDRRRRAERPRRVRGGRRPSRSASGECWRGFASAGLSGPGSRWTGTGAGGSVGACSAPPRTAPAARPSG